MNRRTFLLSGAGAMGAALWGGCRNKTVRRPNIVMIVLDTVRADHTGPWGYARRTTPCLDAFAKEATLYRHASATAPWTLPSHATLFTGQYSFQHGVEGVLSKDAEGKDAIVDPPLPEAAVTVAELLEARGYNTAAFTANTAYMSRPFRLDQGFRAYEVEKVYGLALLDRIRRWVDANPFGPFFLFINFMDAHFHYNTTPCPGAFDEPVSQDPELVMRFNDIVMPGEHPADAQLTAELTKQYDMGIANSDYAAGQVIAHLKQTGLYDESLVIVLSDHGEYLGEHLLAQHSKDLHEEVLHVPLAVKQPQQRAGAWRETPVSLAQVCATMLDTAHISVEERPKPMTPNLDESALSLAEIDYSRNWDFQNPIWGKRFRRLRTAYYEYPWKLIRSSDERHDLFNLEADPKEEKNLFAEMPERAKTMLDRLAAIKPATAAPATAAPATAAPAKPNLSEENIEALKAGGYL